MGFLVEMTGVLLITLLFKTFHTSSIDVLWNYRGRLQTRLQFQFLIFVVLFLLFSAKDFGKWVESKPKVEACKQSQSFLFICTRGWERNYLVDGDTSVELRNSSAFSTSCTSLMGVFSLVVDGLKHRHSLKESCYEWIIRGIWTSTESTACHLTLFSCLKECQ